MSGAKDLAQPNCSPPCAPCFEVQQMARHLHRNAAQRGQVEAHRYRRRNAILVGNKFQHGRSSAGLERRVHFAKQCLASWQVKIVQKVGNQDRVRVIAVSISKAGERWSTKMAESFVRLYLRPSLLRNLMTTSVSHRIRLTRSDAWQRRPIASAV